MAKNQGSFDKFLKKHKVVCGSVRLPQLFGGLMKDEVWTGAPEGLSGHHIADELVSRSSESSGPAIRHPFEDFDRIICEELPRYEHMWGDIERALNNNRYSAKLIALISKDRDFRRGMNKMVTIRREALNEFDRTVREMT